MFNTLGYFKCVSCLASFSGGVNVGNGRELHWATVASGHRDRRDRRASSKPILDPRSSILDPRSSILDPRSSILDSRFSILNSRFSILVKRRGKAQSKSDSKFLFYTRHLERDLEPDIFGKSLMHVEQGNNAYKVLLLPSVAAVFWLLLGSLPGCSLALGQMLCRQHARKCSCIDTLLARVSA